MNRILPLLLAASIPIVLAAPKVGAENKPAAPSYRPRLTGEQLVRNMMADPAVGYNAVHRERAMGYIEGVMDAYAGQRWCPPVGRSLPHELNYILIEEITPLNNAQQKGDAAEVVLAALAKRYPCTGGGAKQ